MRRKRRVLRVTVILVASLLVAVAVCVLSPAVTTHKRNQCSSNRSTLYSVVNVLAGQDEIDTVAVELQEFRPGVAWEKFIGTYDFNERREVTLNFKNCTGYPIRVTGFEVDCGCIQTSEIAGRTLGVEEMLSIPIKYSHPNFGFMRRQVTLLTELGPYVLALSSLKRRDHWLQTSRIDCADDEFSIVWGEVVLKGSRSFRSCARVIGGEQVEPTDVSESSRVRFSNSEYGSAEYIEKIVKNTFRVKQREYYGLERCVVELRISDNGDALEPCVYTVPVVTRHFGKYSVLPATINLGMLRRGVDHAGFERVVIWPPSDRVICKFEVQENRGWLNPSFEVQGEKCILTIDPCEYAKREKGAIESFVDVLFCSHDNRQLDRVRIPVSGYLAE